MAREAREVMIHDRQLVCQHCGGERFFDRAIEVHGASFLDWFTQPGAICYTCSDCGYMHWFTPKE